MIYKSCSRCGRIHAADYNCTHNRPRVNYHKTDTDKLRNTQKWARKSKQIREEAQHLCEVCRDKGIYNYHNLEVHHITKLKDNPEGLLEDGNLICLCIKHHRKADRGEIDKDYLINLANKRIARRAKQW